MQNQNRTGASLDSPMPRRQSCDRCHGQKVRCFTSGPEEIFEPGGQADDEVSINGHFVSSYPCLRCEKAGALCVFSAQLRPGRPILPRDPSSNVPSRKRARTASSRASPSNLASPSNCPAQLSQTSNPFFSSMLSLGDPSLVSQRSNTFHSPSDFPVDPLLLTNNNNTHHLGLKSRSLPLRDSSHDDNILFSQHWLPSPGLHEEDITFPSTPLYPNPPTSIPGPIQILPQTVMPHETTIFASPPQRSPTVTPTTTIFPTPTTATFSSASGWDHHPPNTHLEDLTSICRRVHRAASTLPGGPADTSLWPLTAPSVNDLFDAACSLVHLADQHAASKAAAAPQTPTTTYPFPPSPTPSPTTTNPSPMSSSSSTPASSGIPTALDTAFHILAASCHATVVSVFDDMAGCFLEYMQQTGNNLKNTPSAATVLPQISITINLMSHLLTQMGRVFAAGGTGGLLLGGPGSGMNTPSSPGLMGDFGGEDQFGDLHFGGAGGDFDGFNPGFGGSDEQQRQARVRAKVRMVKAWVEGMGVM
ncbi:hypothetical protein QBC39DRAFT_333163 [Podospora conica]|nr:hypothetical protein QBC39DRAFT_333163 [Schizothecium conicum]